MSDIEQAIASAAAPIMAKCRACDGEGCEADYVGLEMKCIAVNCSTCGGSGKMPVGVFDPVCARHCTGCEGELHHWDYYGDQTEGGEPLLGCKHCTALRPVPDNFDHDGNDSLDGEESDDFEDDCGLRHDGQCGMAGTEHCDFECPNRESELFCGSTAWRQKHGED